MHAALRLLVAVPVLLSAGLVRAEPILPGAARQSTYLGRLSLDVYTYRPNCSNPALLLVFHGIDRNAHHYRDYARPIADAACMIVAAPLFDKARFPSWAYQRGGIVYRRTVQDQSQWTGQLVVALIEELRQQERREIDVYLLAHSAGGQFLSRVAAFTPTGAKRLVITNASTYVLPSLETAAPYGMGGVYPTGEGEAQLRRYLATPITVFLGEEDIKAHNLSKTPEARAQGKTRHERGLNVFAAGRTLAQARGWAFNWRLVELPGVGHSARKMFSSSQAIEALAP